MIGRTLAHYRITAALGAGGMGEVYRATDTTLGRDVAIKVLPAEVAQEPERLARFAREAKLLASLNHPNIAHVYGFESATLPDGTSAHFLAMELVEGEELAQRLKRGMIPVDEALEIAKQVAEALEVAHEHGIVHRDLKPANVKLTPDGKVKVLDFGLAKAHAGEAASGSSADVSQSPTLARTGTQAGVILGTAAYMSPEQARGKPVDKRADIWAFGVVLYEMLTGQRLFAGETVSDVLAAVLKAELDYGKLPAEAPRAVRLLLRRCLERDPRNRLRDIGDARLELIVAPAESASPPQAGLGVSPTHQLAIGALLLVAGALLGRATMAPGARQQAGPAVRFTVTPPASGAIAHVRLSQDGRRLVYKHKDASERRLLVHDLDAFDSRPVAGTEDAVAPFLSPDGAWLGFKQAGKLRKVALAGGDPVDVCELAQQTPDAAWGPANVILFTPAWTNAGLWRVSADGGLPAELTKPDRAKGEVSHFWPDFLPDGRHVLFTIYGGKGLVDSKLGLLDLETRRYEVLFEGALPSYLRSGHILFYKGGAYRAIPFDAGRRRATGTETIVLPEARRLDPFGAEENVVSFSTGGVLAYIEGNAAGLASLLRLAWVSRDGRREDLAFEGNHHYRELSLSPDGRRAAAARVAGGQMQVYVYDLERGTADTVTRDGQNWAPTWHPDGLRLAVTSQSKGSFDARAVPVDGAPRLETLRATDVDEGYWRWAPDGTSAVFRVWSPASGSDLWRANADGSAAAPLVATASSENDPAFSRDGKWLAYKSDAAVYVAAYPSFAQRVLVAQAAENARWSPAANELFFIEAGRVKALAYEVRDGAFRPVATTTLFELGGLTESYDVAPDGRRFLFLAPSHRSPEREAIRVVLDGFAALHRQAATQARTP